LNLAFVNSARRWGGTEKWTRFAAESLASSHDVHLITRSGIFGRPPGVRTHRLPFWGEADPASWAGLIGLARRHRVDVVIPTLRRDYALTRIAAKLGGAKTVLRLGIVRPVRDDPFQRWLWGGADGILVNSAQVRQTLLQSSFIRPSRVRLVYNGVDTERIRGLSAEHASLPFPRYFAAMGELSGRKRMELVVRGFFRFVVRNPESTTGLVLIGDGPESANLRRLAAERGIADRVALTGFLQNPFPLLARAEVFVLASANEGIPNAVLEAMSLGRPVIASAAAGAECIQDGQDGFLLEPLDPEQLGQRLTTLAWDPDLRERIGEAGRRTIQARFDLGTMRRELETFFAEIVRGGPTS
jgi:glycosyltransferase involved in cell wall biosynthesis